MDLLVTFDGLVVMFFLVYLFKLYVHVRQLGAEDSQCVNSKRERYRVNNSMIAYPSLLLSPPALISSLGRGFTPFLSPVNMHLSPSSIAFTFIVYTAFLFSWAVPLNDDSGVLYRFQPVSDNEIEELLSWAEVRLALITSSDFFKSETAA
jgi:hypothetical protein